MSSSDVSPAPALFDILRKLAGGGQTVEQAAAAVGLLINPATANQGDQAIATVEGATIDLGRRQRCGFGEVVFGEGKPSELIIRIVQAQIDAGQDGFVTRIDSTAAAQVRRAFSGAIHNPHARTLRIPCPAPPHSDGTRAESHGVERGYRGGHVAVVTAGSTDAFVAEEAIETLRWMKIPHRRFDDIGVAGPQRLLLAIPELRKAAVIVVMAGMEGALPAALAGHVAVPVIAVPTSSGYGANLGGLTALMGMLTSCAANVAVVNIDAGFKGGYLAGLIAKSTVTG